jgi:hypothetical protein
VPQRSLAINNAVSNNRATTNWFNHQRVFYYFSSAKVKNFIIFRRWWIIQLFTTKSLKESLKSILYGNVDEVFFPQITASSLSWYNTNCNRESTPQDYNSLNHLWNRCMPQDRTLFIWCMAGRGLHCTQDERRFPTELLPVGDSMPDGSRWPREWPGAAEPNAKTSLALSFHHIHFSLTPYRGLHDGRTAAGGCSLPSLGRSERCENNASGKEWFHGWCGTFKFNKLIFFI